jgi:transcriptional regulator with PAS, ATPase and Fis domain
MATPALLSVAARARERLTARYDFDCILGQSAVFRQAIEQGRTAARNHLPVVLSGESGTGKELLAQAIHAASSRRAGRFVAINCGSIPQQLMEAELFGYEPGSFTGAKRTGNSGRFEDADGGTLLLDEVSELPAQAQTTLLRVLQEKEVVRLGSSRPRRVDVRVIAATNKPLGEEIQSKRFRLDLYYRLNVLPISLPPLRARASDVDLLAQAFLAEASRDVGRVDLTFTADALDALRAHPWPGNVRELKNVILRAAATASRPQITAQDLQFDRAVDAPAAGETLWDALIRSERDATDAAHRLRGALMFLAEATSDWERGAPMLSDDALQALHAYRTPGNERELREVVRELKAVVLRAVANAPRLRRPSRSAAPAALEPDEATQPVEAGEETLSDARQRAERSRLLEALGAHGGNRVRTAQHLGISRAGLYRLLDKHGLA